MKLRRCPTCNTNFKPVKKFQVYCSRKCQMKKFKSRGHYVRIHTPTGTKYIYADGQAAEIQKQVPELTLNIMQKLLKGGK